MAGRRHDSTLLAESGLHAIIINEFNDHDGEACYLIGDAAYPLSPWIMTPCKGSIPPRQRRFNKALAKVRVAVEWGFGRIASLFPYIDSSRQQGVLLLSSAGFGKQYIVAGLLTNCRTCF